MKHDHSHGHDHHDGECCGHGHSHKEQTCSHGHEHGEECSHGHVHSSKCSHEHEHGEQCAHSHEHEHVHGPHCSHGHDHEHEDAQADAEWTRRFFLVLQAVVLMMIGGVMCFFVASGRINYFLAPTFRALALWGGIGIMVMGLFNLLVNHSKKECCHDHDHDDDDSGHVHSHEGSVAGRAVTLLLLSSSIAAAAILTPDRQTSQYLMYKESAARRNGINSERLKKENPGLASALN
ncbi:MAG TPA: DUF1980 domain-containing protein, partial [Verrucomicrobiales bacterium]|nr:DUF1980 domain-containing protein [Verrucomicrobiales bacterium]